MKLYINNKEAFLDKELDVNMTFKFVDTYNPSAVKTSYSKTVSLPDCRQNAEIFGDFKVKYNFDLFNDDGRVVEKGYCTLDSIKTVGTQKTYNVTLYGGLGDFFYNLKGDEDSPKTLENLSYSGIPDSGVVMTWDPEYVMRTWMEPESSPITDTFRAVPCIYDDKIMDKSHTIIPNDGRLFSSSIEESGKDYGGFVGQDGSEALLVEFDENNCLPMQDFRSDLMPLGIKYKSIIQACCNPSNNGGYSVYLDPDFFNANNPYWNNMFLLKTLPSLDYDFTIATGEYGTFKTTLARAGNYLASSGVDYKVLSPTEPNECWEVVNGTDLKLNPNYTLVGNKVKYSITPFVQIPLDSVPDYATQKEKTYVTNSVWLQVELELTNVDTGEEIHLVRDGYDPGTVFRCLNKNYGNGITVYVLDLYVPSSPIEGIVNVPDGWTNIRFEVKAAASSVTDMWRLHFRGRWDLGEERRTVRGDFCVPSSPGFISPGIQAAKASWEHMNSNPSSDYYNKLGPYSLYLPESTFTLGSEYLGGNTVFEPLEFTKKDLLQGTSSPFDYLVWFTKMFNLRFYMEPGTKKVSILTANNFVRQLEPLNIQDRICYDKDYSKTRKIIDEGYLKFDLEPNSNPTVEAYYEDYDENLFDSVYPVPVVEGRGQKEYLSNGLKIGSLARLRSPFAIRPINGVDFYGLNQVTPFKVSYVNYEELAPDIKTREYTLNYDDSESQRYDYLTLDDDINNTVVMYSGLDSSSFVGHPAIVSRTSVDMVRFAGKPCWITGVPEGAPGSEGSLLGAEYILTYQIPYYGLVPKINTYSNGLSYSNVDYESLIVTSNIYDKYLKGWLDKIYQDPLVVECWVRLSSPELRRLYWFNNEYWVLTEISNYNYRDEPVKCKFIRYRYA